METPETGITGTPNRPQFAVALSLASGTITIRNSLIESLYFIEDIFSYSMTGKIIFKDNMGILEYGPITGNEVLYLEYGFGKGIKTITFRVHKIQKIRQATQAGTGVLNLMEIIFVHKLFDRMNYLKYSKSWKNKKIHEIVNDICNNMLDIKVRGNFEETNETLEYFYMPYWTPAMAIKWLSKRATSVVNGQSGFLLYESTPQPDSAQIGNIESPVVNFVTLESLLENPIKMEIKDEKDGTSDDAIYQHEATNAYYISKILNWSTSGIDQMSIKNLSGSTLLGFDELTKKFIKKEMTYADSIANQTLYGSYSLFRDISEERTNFINHHENTEIKMKNLYDNKWNKLYVHQQCMNFDVMGDEDRFAGGTIQVNWSGSADSHTKLNKNLSGLYLVKSIVHFFNPAIFPPYRQRLICIKNAYKQSDDPYLVPAVKKKWSF